MKLPTTSTVPDWILELVRVAPDGYTEVYEKLSAEARLKDLMSCLQNPDILNIISQLACALLGQPAAIEGAPLAGLQDILIREQVIGETRGLRRALYDLDEIRSKLLSVINK